MRWLGALTLIGASGACGGAQASLVLDIPSGVLDPKGFTQVEIVLHEPAGDVTRTARVDGAGSFQLDRIDPSRSVWIEATLRSASGAAVGYGRTAVGAALSDGADLVVPVRRPIAYTAGTVSRDADGDANTAPLHWTVAPATYSDLSAGTGLDGSTQLGTSAVMMIGAGPALFLVTQATSDPDGALVGPAQVVPVSTADHQIGAALPGSLTGGVLDGAGTDDGGQLAIGTTTQLFAVDTATGAARALAAGSFARVAIVAETSGELAAVAIKDRGATTGPCSTSAELWWVPLSGAAAGPAHKVATGGFSDLASDRDRAYYVDACKGELGEVTADQVRTLRTIPGTGPAAGSTAGRPTALAVAGGQAYIGVETPPVGTGPASSSLLVGSTDPAAGAMRTLWSEAAQQVLDVKASPDVRRQLDASSLVVGHLELGAGGDYVALTTRAHFHGAEIPELFPEMTIDTEELRVFDAATGGVVQRYRSWCDGVVLVGLGEIGGWECAAAAGQSAPAADAYEHHIGSMTFQFGKK